MPTNEFLIREPHQMTVSDLISQLLSIVETHGNLNVYISRDGIKTPLVVDLEHGVSTVYKRDLNGTLLKYVAIG